MQRKIGRVENYTTSCLVLIFANLLWILLLIWSIWGLPGVMLTGLGLNHLINRLGNRHS